MNIQSCFTTVFTEDLETEEAIERMSFRQLRLFIFSFHDVKSKPVMAVELRKGKRLGERKRIMCCLIGKYFERSTVRALHLPLFIHCGTSPQRPIFHGNSVQPTPFIYSQECELLC